MDLLDGFTHITHAAVRIGGERVIYVDPFQVEGEPRDADLVLCTHDHFDHLSPDDIQKVINKKTVIAVPHKNVKKVKKNTGCEVIGVEPGNRYELSGIAFETVPAYNLDKRFHKRRKNWVGYLLHLEDRVYYFSGDTDYIPEMDSLSADVVFLPVGGTYTCTACEAVEAANAIRPRVAVPLHYGNIVGTREDARTFIDGLADGIEGRILPSFK